MAEKLNDADTQPFPVIEGEETPPWHSVPSLGWDANDDGHIDELESNVPEPLVLRGVLLTVLGLVGYAFGETLDVEWVEKAVAAYAVLVPLVLSVWARRHVSPVDK
jgi:hypothetical protein